MVLHIHGQQQLLNQQQLSGKQSQFKSNTAHGAQHYKQSLHGSQPSQQYYQHQELFIAQLSQFPLQQPFGIHPSTHMSLVHTHITKQ